MPVCLYVTDAERAAIIAGGQPQLGGPYADEAECETLCGDVPGSSSGSGSGSGSSSVAGTGSGSEPGGGPVPDDCGCGVDVEPMQYSVTLGTATGEGCANCVLLNGTHILDYQGKVGDNCFWSKDLGDGCFGGNWIVLTRNPVANLSALYLFAATAFGGSSLDSFTKVGWDCLQTNVLTSNETIDCIGLSTTVDVEPVI